MVNISIYVKIKNALQIAKDENISCEFTSLEAIELLGYIRSLEEVIGLDWQRIAELEEMTRKLDAEKSSAELAKKTTIEQHKVTLQRIAELEASYAECMRQYDHQQERACNAERRLETYKHAAKTMLAHIWSWER